MDYSMAMISHIDVLMTKIDREKSCNEQFGTATQERHSQYTEIDIEIKSERVRMVMISPKNADKSSLRWQVND